MILTPRNRRKLLWRIASSGKTRKLFIRILHYHKDFSFGGFEMKNFFSRLFLVVSSIFYLHPEPWGRWTHFDQRYVFGWVGVSKPPTRLQEDKFLQRQAEAQKIIAQELGKPNGELSLWHGFTISHQSQAPTVTDPGVVINLRIDVKNPRTHP